MDVVPAALPSDSIKFVILDVGNSCLFLRPQEIGADARSTDCRHIGELNFDAPVIREERASGRGRRVVQNRDALARSLEPNALGFRGRTAQNVGAAGREIKRARTELDRVDGSRLGETGGSADARFEGGNSRLKVCEVRRSGGIAGCGDEKGAGVTSRRNTSSRTA